MIDERIMKENLQKYINRTENNPERIEKYIHFYRLADQHGIVPFRYARIAEEYTDDFFADTGIPREEKDWYYERGIPTFKTGWYGLTKENYNDYISDFDFYHPSNYLKKHQLIKWFDDKLTTYYILGPFIDSMPRHFFFIQEGNLVPIDVEFKHFGSEEDLFNIIKNNSVSLKACTGGHGKGFYKISNREGTYSINDEISNQKEISSLIHSLNDYILSDYCFPSKLFRESCGEESFAVIRTVSVFDKDDGPQITAIMVRVGTRTAGIVSDYNGSIYCGVDLKSGRLFNPLLRGGDEDGIIRGRHLKAHPDTGCNLETLTIPDFDKLIDIVSKISSYLAMTPYLVMDIIHTDNGFKILEINSHGQVRNLEPFYPFRKNEYNLKVFQTRNW